MQIKNEIKTNGFRFKKNLGQNFLEDDGILSGIVDSAGVTEADEVLEIGAGAGTLTRALAGKAKRVFSYEIDRSLLPILERTLAGADNAEVIFKDFMRADMREVESDFAGEYIVVANLPYYITSPIVMRLLEEGTRVKRIVVTVQKEVADRFCSESGTPDYGAITVAINALGSARKVMDIPREMFYPAPNVDSAVVRIDVDREKFGDLDYPSLRKVVRAAFSSRRKTLANNLMLSFKMTRSDAEKALSEAGADVSVRGEKLSVEDFIKLAKVLKTKKVL